MLEYGVVIGKAMPLKKKYYRIVLITNTFLHLVLITDIV